ncbi:MAG: hypothetical protein P1Q69_08980 [Candidatus Thorarchaeota archaeon]|nr:hypothetical protein [Candidatus Thorarchaeota archaeon]
MNNRYLIAILIIAIIFAAILGYAFAIATIPIATVPTAPPPDIPPHIVASFIILKTMVSFINIALILLTLGIYLDIYRSVKSKFTLGLITMILLLLMYALTSNPLIHIIFGYQTIGLGPFAILPDIFTTIALLILFYLSLE